VVGRPNDEPTDLARGTNSLVEKSQVYYRPEVVNTSIGRQKSHEEAQLEPYFHPLLERLAHVHKTAFLLSYVSAAGPWRGTLGIVEVSQSDLTQPSKPGIDIQVLMLALYSQFVRFQNHREAFDKLCFEALASENLLFISDCAAFLELLSRVE
jgi:hypothetical protein